MKLRLSTNSIRVRVGREEVARLARGERLETRVDVGPESLKFALRGADDSLPFAGAPEAAASLVAGQLDILISAAALVKWAGSEDQVGIEAQQALSSGGSLSVLIEKDFECLHREDGRDEQDAFPNPAHAAMRR